MTGTGLKKWRPTKRSFLWVGWAMSAIGKDDVLDAKIVWEGAAYILKWINIIIRSWNKFIKIWDNYSIQWSEQLLLDIELFHNSFNNKINICYSLLSIGWQRQPAQSSGGEFFSCFGIIRETSDWIQLLCANYFLYSGSTLNCFFATLWSEILIAFWALSKTFCSTSTTTTFCPAWAATCRINKGLISTVSTLLAQR